MRAALEPRFAQRFGVCPRAGIKRIALACCVLAACIDSQLIDLDPALVEYQLEWQPFTRFDYSVPSATGYCAHPQCLKCSDPEEWDVHPYEVCNVASTFSNETFEQMYLEFASPPYDFQGVLLCFTSPDLTLTPGTVSVDRIVEGGLLYDSGGTVVHPPDAENPTRVFLEASAEDSASNMGFRAVEFGLLEDFLASDPFYAREFEHMRYDNFYSWEATRGLAGRLLNREKPSCLLLSSTKWKRRTRYELELTLGREGQGGSALGGVWAAPLAYRMEAEEEGGRSEDDDLHVDFPGVVSESDGGFLQLSVRGHKGGAVCGVASPPQPPGNVQQCEPGHVISSRTGACIFCPLLNDAARDDQCEATEPPLTWAGWTNDGGGSRGGASRECCPSNTFSQLIGNSACGAPISPEAVDVDLSHLSYADVGQLPARLCQRYSRIRETFVRSYCNLTCLQSGNVLSEQCSCVVEFQDNATWVTDVYMARVIVSDFMRDGRAVFDEHALDVSRARVRREARDLDVRRVNQPTRQKGLQGVWSRGTGSRFEDWYNYYVPFQQDPTLSIHDQLGRVQDFDTLYHAEVNIRTLGILLSDPSLSPAPVTCPGLYDPSGPEAEAPLMYGARDSYWPLYGHPPNEI